MMRFGCTISSIEHMHARSPAVFDDEGKAPAGRWRSQIEVTQGSWLILTAEINYLTRKRSVGPKVFEKVWIGLLHPPRSGSL